jgi:hypothetical protein
LAEYLERGGCGATLKARAIVELIESQRAQIQERGMPVNAFRLLDLLYRRSFVHVKLVSSELGVSFATANGLVEQFEEMRLLDEVTGRKRDRIFRFRPYLRLFEDDESGPIPPETVQETEAAEPALR